MGSGRYNLLTFDQNKTDFIFIRSKVLIFRKMSPNMVFLTINTILDSKKLFLQLPRSNAFLLKAMGIVSKFENFYFHAKNTLKMPSFRGSASDSVGEAYSAPPDQLADFCSHRHCSLKQLT